ncbi:MAG: class I SAM-dependent methyltransferase [Proteobacteria bacterium]|nr:class I SAM-dependent methyltransferase [Pseudomonadota bacterium]
MSIIKPSKQYIEILSKLEFDNIDQKIKDEMAIPSYNHPNPLIRWLMWKRYEVIFKLAKIDKNMIVYEFGCGLGLFLPTISKYAKKTYATDLYPQYAIKLAQDFNLNINFITDITELDETLDLIISADVLEHIESLEELLSLWNKYLKDDGRIIISGPTENFFYKIGRLIAGFRDKGDYHHHNIDFIRNEIIKRGFLPQKEKSLPSTYLKLFKIIEFKKA